MSEPAEDFPASEPANARSAAEMLPEAYERLRQLAQFQMSKELNFQTLQPTALVHEVWLRLRGQKFQCSAQFLSVAAETMRRIMIDRARRKKAAKRGSGMEKMDAHDVEIPYLAPD